MDRQKQVFVENRLLNIINDNYFGDYKIIEKDLYELRIFAGGGIRIYFSIVDDTIFLAIIIGFKESKEQQRKDIEEARDILAEYKGINN